MKLSAVQHLTNKTADFYQKIAGHTEFITNWLKV